MCLRLTKDEAEVISLYAKMAGKKKARVVHGFIKDNMVPMLLSINRKEFEEEMKDPHATDWTNTLPDAALDKAKGEQRKAAQKEV